MNKNKRAWLYCRVAHENKTALEAQKKRLIDFAEKSVYIVAGMSKDTDSRLSMKRQGWKEVEQAERLHRQGVWLVSETDGIIGKMCVAMYMRLVREEG